MTGQSRSKFDRQEKVNFRLEAPGLGKDASMRDPNAFVGTREGFKIPDRAGTTEAFEQILSNDRSHFYRKAYRLLGNAADAEDAVQDALLAAYTHLDQFKGRAQMSTWLTSIVLNSARMQLRRRRRFVQVPLDEPGGEMQTLSLSERLRDHRPNAEDEYRGSELSARLTRFPRVLSPTLRRTFELRDVDGLSIRETARILGVPCGTVKAQSARAHKKLKQFVRQALRPRSSSLPNQWLGFANAARSSAGWPKQTCDGWV
jgi:RNA polymerase sigma factor (sigma-70 family)